MHAVAARLRVSTTALYRHLDGRWELERLVGESLLAELELPDDPAHSTQRHLLAFALRLREHTLAHQGLASYLQVLFPRGDEGCRLLATEIAALTRRGYAADTASVLCGSVATLTISLAASEESDIVARGGEDGFAHERQATVDRLNTDPLLGPAHADLPAVSTPDFVRLLLTASIRGLVAVARPGRSVHDVVAELALEGEL